MNIYLYTFIAVIIFCIITYIFARYSDLDFDDAEETAIFLFRVVVLSLGWVVFVPVIIILASIWYSSKNIIKLARRTKK